MSSDVPWTASCEIVATVVVLGAIVVAAVWFAIAATLDRRRHPFELKLTQGVRNRWGEMQHTQQVLATVGSDERVLLTFTPRVDYRETGLVLTLEGEGERPVVISVAEEDAGAPPGRPIPHDPSAGSLDAEGRFRSETTFRRLRGMPAFKTVTLRTRAAGTFRLVIEVVTPHGPVSPRPRDEIAVLVSEGRLVCPEGDV